MLENLCVYEGQKMSEYQVNLAEGKTQEGEKLIFDCVRFSRMTAVSERTSMFSGITMISHVKTMVRLRRLEFVPIFCYVIWTQGVVTTIPAVLTPATGIKI